MKLTLGDYRRLVAALAESEDSSAVKFFDQRIAEQGADMEVIAAESQMMALIAALLQER